jgi:archaeal flagellar protein FlaJ
VIDIVHAFFQHIAERIPDLKPKLRQAGMQDKPEEFIRKTFLVSVYMSVGLFVFLFLLLYGFGMFHPVMFAFMPLLCFSLLFYLIKLPDAKIISKQKEISREIVFAGRFLVIELQSGVPLYNALNNLAKNYPAIGMYSKVVIDKVDLGTSMEDALNEAVELSPSEDFRKLLFQVINSMRTGSDVASALSTAVDQIAKRQQIQVSEYGKKLNPLAMFYMMIAVIAPSLGMTMLIIVSSFVNFTLSLTMLIILAMSLGFIQFMFLSIIKFSRPPIDL